MTMAGEFDYEAHDSELDRNYDEFKRRLPELIRSDKGRHALMRHGAVIAMFDDRHVAYEDALRRFPDHFFSIQEVTDEPLDLGVLSHVNLRPV
jgi:hypothetical protein